MYIVLGGMGGIMGKKKDIVKEAVHEYAINLAEKEVEKSIKENKDTGNYMYESYIIDCRNKGVSDNEVELKAKNEYINEMSKAIQKRIWHNVSNNYGAGKNFSLYNYRYFDIYCFLNFMESDVINYEDNLLRKDRTIGEYHPNQKITKYFSGYKIKYEYRYFFYYIMNHGRFYNGLLDVDYNEIYMLAQKDYQSIIGDLGKIIQTDLCSEMKYYKGLYFLLDCALSVMRNENDKFNCYIKCEIIWNALMYLVTQIVKDREMHGIISKSLENAQKQWGLITDNIISSNKKGNVFEDYAITMLLNVEGNRNNFVYNVLNVLYDKGKCLDKVRVTKKQEEKVTLLSEWIKNNTDINMDFSNKVQLKEILYEVFHVDRKIIVQVNDKKQEYYIFSSVNRILKGEEYTDDVIVVTEKVRRAIMIQTEGEEYYKFINDSYRKLYKVRELIFEYVKKGEIEVEDISIILFRVLKIMARC